MGSQSVGHHPVAALMEHHSVGSHSVGSHLPWGGTPWGGTPWDITLWGHRLWGHHPVGTSLREGHHAVNDLSPCGAFGREAGVAMR